MDAAAPPLRHDRSGTAHAALVLLAFGPATGYELKQRAERTLRFFFAAPAMSQIYSELQRLAVAGLVGRTETGYELLPAGRDALARWLAEGELSPTVFKSHLALRLIVGHLAEPERLASDLAAERNRAATDLADVIAVRDSLDAEHPQFGWAWMVANWGTRYYGDMVAQLDQLAALLERRTGAVVAT
ncbi:MAG TPA: PadR family transcriptional regulator [Ilumatobacter sp.]|nr:PadR family transcriptional regulator [Ilumatobacter sp.]